MKTPAELREAFEKWVVVEQKEHPYSDIPYEYSMELFDEFLLPLLTALSDVSKHHEGHPTEEIAAWADQALKAFEEKLNG